MVAAVYLRGIQCLIQWQKLTSRLMSGTSLSAARRSTFLCSCRSVVRSTFCPATWFSWLATAANCIAERQAWVTSPVALHHTNL